jgi:hypothetical protein
MDFAKRKYRSGYYVQLSTGKAISRQPIAISQKSSSRKVISQKQFPEPAIIEPAIPEGRRIPGRMQLSEKAVSYQPLAISQKQYNNQVISQKQNVPIYKGRENRGMVREKNSNNNTNSPDNKPDKKEDPKGIIFFILAILFGVLGVLQLLSPNIFPLMTLGTFFLPALLFAIFYHVLNQKPDWQKKGLPKPEWKKQKFSVNASLSLFFVLLPMFLLAVGTLFNFTSDAWLTSIVIFSSFNFFIALGIVLAIIAFYEFKKHPELGGRGLAAFAIFFGLLLSYFSFIFLYWTAGP